MKIKAKYQTFIFVFLMALPLTLVLSVCNVLIFRGSTHFFEKWLSTWGISFLIAYPVALIIVPLAKRITATIKWIK